MNQFLTRWVQLVFDDNFSSVRVIPLLDGIVSITRKFSSKTVLDTLFVPFYFTKISRTDGLK